MGQTQGGNAGNLELLKKIEEQRAEIENQRQNIKHGTITLQYNNNVYALQGNISFSEPFDNDNYAISLTPHLGITLWSDNGLQRAYAIENKTKNGFSLRLHFGGKTFSEGDSITFDWIAIK